MSVGWRALTRALGFSLQLRGALGTLMTEGAVVIHGDNVRRV
jgi:hypothetical protein